MHEQYHTVTDPRGGRTLVIDSYANGFNAIKNVLSGKHHIADAATYVREMNTKAKPNHSFKRCRGFTNRSVEMELEHTVAGIERLADTMMDDKKPLTLSPYDRSLVAAALYTMVAEILIQRAGAANDSATKLLKSHQLDNE